MPFFGYVAMAMCPQKAYKWLKIAPFSHQSTLAEEVYFCLETIH